MTCKHNPPSPLMNACPNAVAISAAIYNHRTYKQHKIHKFMALFLVSWYSVFQIAGNTSGNLSLQSQYLPDHSKELGMKIYVLCKHCNSCTVLTCRNEACTQ